MKAKIFTLVFAFLFLSLSLDAQAQRKDKLAGNTTAYIEFGGPGVIMSFNIDQRFSSWKATGFGARAGVGFGRLRTDGLTEGETIYQPGEGEEVAYGKKAETYFTIPFALNYVFNIDGPTHALEIGAGGTYLSKKLPVYNRDNGRATPGNFLWHFSAMYRFIPRVDGLSLRLGLTPIIGTNGDLIPSGAISLGYSF